MTLPDGFPPCQDPLCCGIFGPKISVLLANRRGGRHRKRKIRSYEPTRLRNMARRKNAPNHDLISLSACRRGPSLTTPSPEGCRRIRRIRRPGPRLSLRSTFDEEGSNV